MKCIQWQCFHWHLYFFKETANLPNNIAMEWKNWILAIFYDDAIELIGKLPEVAAIICRNKYHGWKHIASNSNLDWAGNFAHMLGFNNNRMKQALRCYLTIHSDHKGGNVSAHAYHLVASALSDPYLSYLLDLMKSGFLNLRTMFKEKLFQNNLLNNLFKILKDIKVIPGYGHAVLRQTDLRFTHQL